MNNNLPYSFKPNRIFKTFAGVGVSLTILFSGSALLTAQPANAAAAEAATAGVPTEGTPGVSTATLADQIIATGKQYLGVDYEFGAKGGQTGSFDCSSFTQYVFKQNGIDLPRSSRQQAEVGTAVSKDDLQPGDLIFSDTNKDGVINHVSIYMGNGQVLQTYRVGIGVTVSDFEGSVWDRTFVTARRVIPDNGQATTSVTNPADTREGTVGLPADSE